MAPVQKAFTTQQEASLFYAARQGSSKAMDQLISSYMPLAVFLASRISGVERDDLVQEGLVALLSAVRGFDEGRGIRFATYAGHCIENAMITAQRRQLAKKRDGDGHLSFDDAETSQAALAQPDVGDPQQIVDQKEHIRLLMQQVDTQLSPLEKQVVLLRLDGYSYKAISDMLEKPEKSIDNALTRVRKKLRYAQ
ncbi:sigma-70 family RNA polymerase sigma factor [Neobittarella massiliensis]|uniref:RNA polymerase sigma factor SigS n=1 Tax=Neobittarella massiliensis (ex Bilen et al. 2018) TaxID=2041842 RepID=A0A8J6IPY5_9FIRM|nr:sigma-70 family RNA polymerase sigma factor [Neobittarella massiliensis]MBC3516171.1 sigma-70 family RNA polymerase sigma factor [Neobittarella massiliensis]